MRIAHFFVERPIFAGVISILIMLIGTISYLKLPVTQYPEIAPPSISVTAVYPGATAEIASKTVANILEQQINGVENMLYMKSENTADGRTSLTVTFKQGTDIDLAQVLVQNRVSLAEPFLPVEAKRQGVSVKKNSPDLMMVLYLLSPDGSRDNLYVSNYARTQIIGRLERIPGVGGTFLAAERAYAMRIWIDPERAFARGLTANEIIHAIRQYNVQIASGILNQEPVVSNGGFEYTLETHGRLQDPESFANIIVKQGDGGRIVRLRDVARVELAAKNYAVNGYLDNKNALPIGIFQRPGSNALKTSQAIHKEMATISDSLPEGIEYDIVFDSSRYIETTIHEIYKTIFEAIVLVVAVILVFLQNWRAALIPIIAIPVSLIGTFAMMSIFGASLNNLSLFGLVLAIGIVVDDAIIVVENIERYIQQGLSPLKAAHKTIDEVGGALIAMSLVLVAVFLPTAFIPGVSGAFYGQFALTITASTIISLIVSLTLSPALGALLLKPHVSKNNKETRLKRIITAPARIFNTLFEKLADSYGLLTKQLVKRIFLMLLLYGALIVLTVYEFQKVPSGFIPEQDQGYLISVIQLPPGASLERTDKIIRQASDILHSVEGIKHVMQFAGLDGATFTNASNAGVIFAPLLPFEERENLHAKEVLQNAQMALGQIEGAVAFMIMPPSVRGLGISGGWKLYLQDLKGIGIGKLEQLAQGIIAEANQQPELSRVYTFFNTKTPRIFVDIDKDRAEMLNVSMQSIIDTLEIYLGSKYVNDFNFLDRTYNVIAQVDGQFRDAPEDINNLRVRSEKGDMIPLGTLISLKDKTGPIRLSRYNNSSAIDISGSTQQGYSTGQAMQKVESLLKDAIPEGISFEWTELALQQNLAAEAVSPIAIFGLAVLFMFLLLAALYESWLLPISIILIVPMCLLSAVGGIIFKGIDNNILVQVGFIVLIGLAAKNAILIIEFAKQSEEKGLSLTDAIVAAAKTRLRPILMTSYAFILGVIPLAIATGPGAEMRRSLGITVFSGMLGVTFFGLIFTPVFYTFCRRTSQFLDKKK